MFCTGYKPIIFDPSKTLYIMKTNNRKTPIESKVGTVTKTFSRASSLVWNSKRRYK